MFPAKPLPPGRDLNEVERQDSVRAQMSFFGTPSARSSMTADAMQCRVRAEQISIEDLFAELDQRRQQAEISYSASALADDDNSEEEKEEQIAEPVAPSKARKPVAKSSKASGKSKAASSVVKKPAENLM